jgi:quinol monooxygenase YgiN
MINVVATIRIKEGRRDEFIEKFKANVPNVLAEEGCIRYSPTVDVESGFPIQDKNPNSLTVIEQWETMEALQAHAVAPHMGDFRRATKGLSEGVTLKVLQDA